MDARVFFPLVVVATFFLVIPPADASLYLTSESFDPDAPLIPGMQQHCVVTYNLLPSGATTFIRGHELQMQTDLTGALWNIQVIENGRNAAQQSASGNAAFVNGALLSYPTSNDVSLSVTIDGTIPATATGQVTILLVEEIDNSGNVVPGSLMTVVQPVAGQGSAPATTGIPTLTPSLVPSTPIPTRADGFTLVPAILAVSLLLGLSTRRGN